MDRAYTECARVARSIVDKQWVDNLRSPRAAVVVRATALIWIQLTISWALALYGPVWLSIVSFIINCAMVQAMLLWTHEASHYTLTQNRRLNDIWCDIFFAGPIGMTVAAYRAKHMTHHAHLGTELDQDSYPYRFNVKGARALASLMLRTLSGFVGASVVLNKYAVVRGDGPASVNRGAVWIPRLVTLVFNVGLLATCIAVGRWYLYFVLWAYPIVVVAILLNIVRTIAEHQPEDFPTYRGDQEVAMRPIARTTVPNWFEKWLLYQANFNYHVEHHLFPAIPQHNLALLHRHMLERGFYNQFPECLQRSGIARFVALSRNRINDDFSGPVADALTL